MTRSNRKGLGIIFIFIGIIVGIIYPLMLIYLDEQHAIKLIIYTISSISLLIGALIGAIGVVLIRGFKTSGSEDTS